VFAGILLGLGAALCHSLSYIFSGLFVRKFSSSTIVLLTLSHAVMGVLSLILLPMVWPATMPPFTEYAFPLFAGVACYGLGQTGLFMALKRTDASRISPLLGIKLVLLAIISVTFLGAHYGIGKWTAVILTLTAAALLNESGGRIHSRSLLWVLLACLGYSFSDLSIKALVGHFDYMGILAGSLLCAAMSYTICGALSLIGFLFIPRPSRQMWLHAVPFALAWMAAMLCLFACFASIGVVFGNIVQSTRGLLSIALGALIARAGYTHLERIVPRKVLLRRGCAAILMVVAIALFSRSA